MRWLVNGGFGSGGASRATEARDFSGRQDSGGGKKREKLTLEGEKSTHLGSKFICCGREPT